MMGGQSILLRSLAQNFALEEWEKAAKTKRFPKSKLRHHQSLMLGRKFALRETLIFTKTFLVFIFTSNKRKYSMLFLFLNAIAIHYCLSIWICYDSYSMLGSCYILIYSILLFLVFDSRFLVVITLVNNCFLEKKRGNFLIPPLRKLIWNHIKRFLAIIERTIIEILQGIIFHSLFLCILYLHWFSFRNLCIKIFISYSI